MIVFAAIETQAAQVGAVVEKFAVSRDDTVYECFPSLAQLSSGRIVLVYRESDAHRAKDFCRLIVRTSDDGGRTFSNRRVLADEKKTGGALRYHNCPKVQQLRDGRVLVLCDVFPSPPGETVDGLSGSRIFFWTSDDECRTWSSPVNTGVGGIMPDEVVELDDGDWLLATQFRDSETNNGVQRVSRSSDKGRTWSDPITIAARKGYDFCEASILRLPAGELVCYMRENSNIGRPGYKSISTDGGRTWKGPYDTQMEGCHRPVAHLTRSGMVLITYRHQIGGASPWAKNVFAFLESTHSALEPDRNKQNGILLPLDHDRSPKPDSGYTGWVETAPGEFLAVTYINDDAPMAQIRGYRFREPDF